jgi:hypothetical protein
MPITYENISTTTLSGGGASTITFSSIPATFTDLRVVITGTSTTGGQNVLGTLNSNSSTIYSGTRISGFGTTAASDYRQNDVWFLLNQQGTTTTQPFLIELDLFSYTSSEFKTVLSATSENTSPTAGGVGRSVHLWRNTSAITAVSLFPSGGNFAAGTTATLYGIKNA